MATLTLSAPTQYGIFDGGWDNQTGSIWGDGRGTPMGAVRWSALGIPKGSTVTSAVLTTDFEGRNFGFTVGVMARDTAPDLSDTYWHSSPTLSPVVVNEPSGPGGPSSLDFTAGMNALVNRAGWVSGNSFGIYTSGAVTYALEPGSFEITYTLPWDAGVDQTVQPWETVTLTGTPSGGNWSQVSGESVTLGGSGATRTFVAPAKMTQHQMVFSYGGSSNMTVTVAPAKHAIVGAGGSLTPARFRVL